MLIRHSTLLLAACAIITASLVSIGAVNAQEPPPRLVIKNGETIELYPLWYVANCHSIMIGLPEIEVLEGAPELTFSLREEPVLPRRLGCANKVPGAMLLLTAKGVTAAAEAKLVYRVKYNTKDGPRQTARSYVVSLFP